MVLELVGLSTAAATKYALFNASLSLAITLRHVGGRRPRRAARGGARAAHGARRAPHRRGAHRSAGSRSCWGCSSRSAGEGAPHGQPARERDGRRGARPLGPLREPPGLARVTGGRGRIDHTAGGAPRGGSGPAVLLPVDRGLLPRPAGRGAAVLGPRHRDGRGLGALLRRAPLGAPAGAGARLAGGRPVRRVGRRRLVAPPRRSFPPSPA